ncbi:MAG TPA: hypothetical protein VLN45_07070, partial [Ignavibacteriaceae bacterium]|nr:hypothetical protein [Ignavibacteriaceae bacterium]
IAQKKSGSAFGLAFYVGAMVATNQTDRLLHFDKFGTAIGTIVQISDGIQGVGIGVLRGLTDVKIPTIITFIAYWVLALPIAYLLGFNFNYGVEGIWIGLFLGLTVSAVLLTIRFNFKSKHLVEI